MIMNSQRDEYLQKLSVFTQRPDIRIMKQYRQHVTSNTFEHVCHVARVSHQIQLKLNLDVDEDALLRGAVLHDYYLYDFSENPVGAYEHGTTHAEKALRNAEKAFVLNDTEKNIIYSHMWPLNLTHLPRTKEAWIVSVADKICAVQEMLASKKDRSTGSEPAA